MICYVTTTIEHVNVDAVAGVARKRQARLLTVNAVSVETLSQLEKAEISVSGASYRFQVEAASQAQAESIISGVVKTTLFEGHEEDGDDAE